MGIWLGLLLRWMGGWAGVRRWDTSGRRNKRHVPKNMPPVKQFSLARMTCPFLPRLVKQVMILKGMNTTTNITNIITNNAANLLIHLSMFSYVLFVCLFCMFVCLLFVLFVCLLFVFLVIMYVLFVCVFVCYFVGILVVVVYKCRFLCY